MKISAINATNTFNTRKNILKTQNRNLNNQISSAVFTSYPKIYFTSDIKNSIDKPSENFINTVENENQRNEIIKNILTDPNGKYNHKKEKLFLDSIEKSKELLKEDEIFYDETYLPELIEANKLAFMASKDENGKIQNAKNLGLLAGVAYIGIMNRCSDIPKIFEISKDNKGVVDVLTAEAIVNIKTNYDNSMKPLDALDFIYNFATSNGKVDFEKLDNVINLFNAAECSLPTESKYLYSIVADESGKIDENKCDFAINAFENLMKFAHEEVGDEQGNVYPGFRFLVGECINAIIERGVFKNGFNPEEAMQSLNDWKEYVSDKGSKLDNNIGILVKVNSENGSEDKVISIRDYILNNLPEPEMYNNNLYRLYALLNINPISRNKANIN